MGVHVKRGFYRNAIKGNGVNPYEPPKESGEPPRDEPDAVIFAHCILCALTAFVIAGLYAGAVMFVLRTIFYFAFA